jgi:ABC-type sugar transport system ATPase subunit
MSGAPHIVLDGLAKSWGASRGVEQVDLAVAQGEFVVLLGPSGCGKSTTLRMIAGLETPTRGRIHIALQRELGMTVFYVTHDQTEAMAMADRIVLMNEGRIEQVGTPSELYERPATAFVATFVGSPPMVLLPAADVPGALRPPAADTGAADLLVGVRPEAIRPAAPGTDAYPARVTEIEYLGAESLVYLATDAGPLVARLPGRVPYRLGAEIGLTWPRQAAQLFDRGSGRRMASATDALPGPTPQFAIPQ